YQFVQAELTMNAETILTSAPLTKGSAAPKPRCCFHGSLRSASSRECCRHSSLLRARFIRFSCAVLDSTVWRPSLVRHLPSIECEPSHARKAHHADNRGQKNRDGDLLGSASCRWART